MNIAILGCNLEAWTLAAALASTGCTVTLTADNETANSLPVPDGDIAEPDLLQMLQQHQSRIRPAASVPLLFRHYDLVLETRQLNEADYRQTLALGLQAGDRQNSQDEQYSGIYALTAPVAIGCTDRLQAYVETEQPGNVSCLYWPCFIEAGRALESFTRAGRILLGGGSEDAKNVIRSLLHPFNRSRDNLMLMSSRAAEMTKIAINGMLATRVSLMNELAALASAQDVDIEQVRLGIGSDPRIGHQYLYPGCGFGGEAFSDTLNYLTSALQHCRDHNPDTSLLSSVLGINRQQKDLLFQKFWRYYNADIQGKTVALWGCAFKPETASIQGSPALHLIKTLQAHQVKIRVFDPMAQPVLAAHLAQESRQEQVHYCHSPEEAAEGCDAIMLVTEWKIFWNLDLKDLAKRARHPLLLDGRNIYAPQQAEAAGWIYSGVGRGEAI